MDPQVRLVADTISLAGILASVAAPKAKWLSGGVAAGLTFSAPSNTCSHGQCRLPCNRSKRNGIEGVLEELRNGRWR